MAESENTIPYGYCQCGCGQKTNLARQTDPHKHWKIGEPIRFINGHSSRGINNPKWNGGRKQTDNGILVYMPHHPFADRHGCVLEHRLIAEKALGKYLPPKAVIHHHTPEDLVICQDQAYHMLIHQRTRAYNACGNADWKKCPYCKKYDAPENMDERPGQNGWNSHFHHRKCYNAYQNELQCKKRKTHQDHIIPNPSPPGKP